MSLKERAMLSQKLEGITKEKKELSKSLAVTQKENRAAKQQLEELLQEKGVLIKKLENATKEFKSNIKSKKLALAKLEEVTSNVENLKQQLEQVTRDKEILENKLKVLEKEYEKLQERVILSNPQNFSNQEQRPERDVDARNNEEGEECRQNQADNELSSSTEDMKTNLGSVSQTEMDMKKIQVKIKQLEKNLEIFNSKPDIPRGESDLSLSLVGNISESQVKTEDENDFSDYPFTNSPRLRYWGGKAGDVLQTLAAKVNDKVRFLDRIRETGETGPEENSSQESLDEANCSTRIVSSSIAFQNFLKSLQPNMRRQFRTHCDSIF
ncbi:hypothetical protein JTB14_003478 [Gonioctena quinquepunctata]|nr:hypothetical protein JTB14_003478 [Gonioctena quinquepunctata]